MMTANHWRETEVRHDARTLIPRVPHHTVARDRLLRRLNRLAPLSMLNAVVGAGKTQLVAGWAHEQRAAGSHVVWINGGPALASPDAFGAHLREMIAPDDANVREPHAWVDDIAGLCASIDQRIVIVIDDAHHLVDAQIGAGICELLARSHRMHMVLCTSGSHPWKELAREHGLDITLIGTHDWAVSLEELVAFAAVWSHDIDLDRARQLQAVSGGSLAVAELVLEETPTGSDALRTTGARVFIRDTVISQLSAGELRLLKLLSLAETVDAGLVHELATVSDLVMQIMKAANPLNHIRNFERHGILVPVDSADDVDKWGFPPLMRQVLDDIPVTSGQEEIARAHWTIADHLAGDASQAEQLRAVLRHARAGEHWSLLGQLWTRQGPQLAQLDNAELASAFEGVPPAVASKYPMLALAELMVTGIDQLESDLDQHVKLRSFVARFSDSSEGPSLFNGLDGVLLRGTEAMIRHRMRGNLQRAIEMGDQLNAALDEKFIAGAGSVAQLSGAWFDMQRSLSALAANDVERALMLSRKSFTGAREAGADFIAARAAGQAALALTLHGLTRESHWWLHVHGNIASSASWLGSHDTVPAQLADALLRLDHLEQDDAGSSLADLKAKHEFHTVWRLLAHVMTQEALVFGDPLATLSDLVSMVESHPKTLSHGTTPRIVNRCIADLMLAVGELNRADQFLSAVGIGTHPFAVPKARLALIAGDYATARGIAAAESWAKHTALRDRAELLMIEAAADLGLGDEEAAVVAFARARTVSSQIDTLIPYLGIPARVREELFRISGLCLSPAAAAKLSERKDIYPAEGTLIVLSAREAIVLREMVDHETLKEIAASLSVSVNTIKKQSVAIYAKLGVHDREAAVARALKLGLLGDIVGPR